MRPSRLVAAALLAAAALVTGLFAHDLRATQGAFTRDDLRTEAGLRTPGSWRGGTILPLRWSEGALGLRADRELRLAVRQFRATYGRPAGFDGGQAAVRARDAAEAALAARAQDRDGARASQALDLLALLLFGDSTAGAGAGAASKAVADLQQAIALDDRNDAAKANLELVLSLLRARGSRIGSAAAAGPRSTGHRGAGSGTPGQGY